MLDFLLFREVCTTGYIVVVVVVVIVVVGVGVVVVVVVVVVRSTTTASMKMTSEFHQPNATTGVPATLE